MSDDIDYKDLASRFEAVKIAMTHDKNGYIMKLAIQPDDAPTDLLRDPVGTRYMIAAVRLNLQDEPVQSKEMMEGAKIVAQAAMLSKDKRFQEFLAVTNRTETLGEDTATNYLKEHCGITSRAELKEDERAQKRFLALRSDFTDYLRRSNRG